MATRQQNELIDRLRVSPRGMKYVVAATLAAAAVALTLVLPIEPMYRTTAVVGSDPSAQNANDRTDFIADMRAALVQPSVVEAVSNETGVPARDLREGIDVARLGDSNLIRVGFESRSDDPDVASEVVTLAPAKALEFLRRGRVETAQAAVDELQTELDAVVSQVNEQNRAITTAEEANGNVPPTVTVSILRDQLAELNTIVLTNEPGDPDRETAEESIAVLNEQLEPALVAAADYSRTLSERDDSIARRRTLTASLAAATEELRDVSSAPSITVQTVAVEQSPVRSAAVQVFAITIAALLGALLVVSALERRRAAAADPPALDRLARTSADPSARAAGAEPGAANAAGGPSGPVARRAPAKSSARKKAARRKAAAAAQRTPGPTESGTEQAHSADDTPPHPMPLPVDAPDGDVEPEPAEATASEDRAVAGEPYLVRTGEVPVTHVDANGGPEAGRADVETSSAERADDPARR